MSTELCYRRLHGWKYELQAEFRLLLPPELRGAFVGEFVSLCGNEIVIEPYYAWDGASGPTFDSQSTLRASLVHDALYQLIRLGALPRSAKGAADQLLHDLLVEDGMGGFRAWCWLKAVNWFGRPWRD